MIEKESGWRQEGIWIEERRKYEAWQEPKDRWVQKTKWERMNTEKNVDILIFRRNEKKKKKKKS